METEVKIPTEGVWFDRIDAEDGRKHRRYWKDGGLVIAIEKRKQLFEVNRLHEPIAPINEASRGDGLPFWVVAVIWKRDGKTCTHEFPPVPWSASLVADALVDAVGIGVEAVQPARHLSEIGGNHVG